MSWLDRDLIAGAPIVSGSGFPHVTTGTFDAIARAVDLSSTDVTGTLPISKLQQSSATVGQVPTWSGSQWQPATPATANDGAAGNVTLEKYGAVDDGVTDVHTAYTSALSSGRTIWIGAYTYSVPAYTGGLAADTSLFGTGSESVLQNLTNQAIVKVNGDRVQVSNVRTFGTFGAGASNHGVDIGSHSDVIVSNIWAFESGGAGVHYSIGSVANMGPIVMGLRSYVAASGSGFWAEQGEYAVLVGASLYGGSYGIRNDGGNNVFIGVHADLNTTGILVDNGDSNDGHGIVVGCTFNHCVTYAADVKPLTNGFNFHASHFYYADIRVVGTDGGHATPSLTSFYDNNLDVNAYTLTNALVQFDGNVFPMANANTVTNSGSTIIARPNNMKLDGTPFDFGVAYQWDCAGTRNLNVKWAGTTVRSHWDGAHGLFYAGQGTTEAATVIGPLVGNETTFAAIYGLGTGFNCGTAPTATNAFFYTDGAAAYINAPHTLGFGHIYFVSAGATFVGAIDCLNANQSFGGNGAASPVVLDWSTSTTPKFQSGTAATAFTVGTNKSGATLSLQCDAAVDAITMTDPKVMVTSHGGRVCKQLTKGTNFTIDSGSTNDDQIWMTAACTITLPDPTAFAAGRSLEIVVNYDPASGGGTIARHSGEKINGATADLTLGVAHKFSCLIIRTNGTDWVIGLAAKA